MSCWRCSAVDIQTAIQVFRQYYILLLLLLPGDCHVSICCWAMIVRMCTHAYTRMTSVCCRNGFVTFNYILYCTRRTRYFVLLRLSSLSACPSASTKATRNLLLYQYAPQVLTTLLGKEELILPHCTWCCCCPGALSLSWLSLDVGSRHAHVCALLLLLLFRVSNLIIPLHIYIYIICSSIVFVSLK